MHKSARTIFIVLNILYFAFNFLAIPYLPNPILFGWLSLHLLCFFGTSFVGSVLWLIYYRAFFARQKDI